MRSRARGREGRQGLEGFRMREFLARHEELADLSRDLSLLAPLAIYLLNRPSDARALDSLVDIDTQLDVLGDLDEILGLDQDQGLWPGILDKDLRSLYPLLEFQADEEVHSFVVQLGQFFGGDFGAGGGDQVRSGRASGSGDSLRGGPNPALPGLTGEEEHPAAAGRFDREPDSASRRAQLKAGDFPLRPLAGTPPPGGQTTRLSTWASTRFRSQSTPTQLGLSDLSLGDNSLRSLEAFALFFDWKYCIDLTGQRAGHLQHPGYPGDAQGPGQDQDTRRGTRGCRVPEREPGGAAERDADGHQAETSAAAEVHHGGQELQDRLQGGPGSAGGRRVTGFLGSVRTDSVRHCLDHNQSAEMSALEGVPHGAPKAANPADHCPEVEGEGDQTELQVVSEIHQQDSGGAIFVMDLDSNVEYTDSGVPASCLDLHGAFNSPRDLHLEERGPASHRTG
ncbi:hypothetical protein OJ253_682 [Cryptosporidium canis]|uniref:Uncharacterized protein n=1 Tax=Cryptosporidium canis TaxID=195482 RepID=A0A9D5DIB3_9CRYT|nr:hypothetical protein OJ253_682 [Cryptosporidium canis]